MTTLVAPPEQVTPEIDIDLIDIKDGPNTRRRLDPDALKALARDIERNGIIQPIVIEPAPEGRYWAVDGRRRRTAAKMAGLKRVPYTLRHDEDSDSAGFSANAHQEPRDMVEWGEALEEMAKKPGLGTNKALAEEVSKSPAWVAVRRRLVKLPPKARESFIRGAIPLDAEPLLRKVAAVSPRIAECLCEVFEKGDTEAGDFVREFDLLLYDVADDKSLDEPPTMLDPHQIRLSEVFDDDRRRELADRLKAASGSRSTTTDPCIRLSEDDVDAARAARVLLELKGKNAYGGISFITDKAMAADLIVKAIERREKEAKKAAKKQKAGKKSPEAKKFTERRVAAEKEREERREAAQSYNDRVGRNLMKARGAQSRKKFGLARAKALFIDLLTREESIAANGVALVMPQLRGLQPEGDKKGSETKAVYAKPEQATKYLIERIEEAKSVDEVLELYANARIAADLADPDALSPGELRLSHFDYSEGKVPEILAAEIKEVAPRRSPKQKKLDKAA
jgi:ParB/RepB/Spo0J family partition protein